MEKIKKCDIQMFYMEKKRFLTYAIKIIIFIAGKSIVA
jgi:hypothetical protein